MIQFQFIQKIFIASHLNSSVLVEVLKTSSFENSLLII